MSVNRLNNRFVDSVVKLTSTVKIAPAQSPPRAFSINPFLLRPVTATEIRRIINSLACYAPYGHDNVSISILKKSPMVVIQILEMIFNKSITTSTFPDAWKCAIVTSSHKKGDVYDMANYRPVAMLPIISKVFEKLMNEQLRDYLQMNNTLHDSQQRLRQGRSFESALLHLTKLLFTLRSKTQYTYIAAQIFHGLLAL